MKRIINLRTNENLELVLGYRRRSLKCQGNRPWVALGWDRVIVVCRLIGFGIMMTTKAALMTHACGLFSVPMEN